jgi:methionyl aminopeptidase
MRPKTDAEIKIMRESGRMLAIVLDTLKTQIAEGMTTKELADIASKKLKSLGGQPAFFNHEGFPGVICISVNDEIVHGVPSVKKRIKDGDVVGLDFGVVYKSFYTDSAITVVVGNQTEEIKRLVEGTKKALDAGIAAIKGDGTRVGDISAAVQRVLDTNKLGVIRDLVGHGVGDSIHEAPNIPNYGVSGTGPKLSAGMTIAIEPMATLGSWQVNVLDDGWTVVSRDGSLSAHFEHTVLITEDSAEILTAL